MSAAPAAGAPGGSKTVVHEDPGKEQEGTSPSAPTVVVGVDGSEGADQALTWAVREAAMLGSGLEVCSFWHLPVIAGYPAAYDLHDFAEAARDVVEKALARVAELDSSLEAHGVIEESSAAAGLVRRSQGARLLVVGSRGLGGFRGLLLGSVGRHCAEHARCPVMVVRPPR